MVRPSDWGVLWDGRPALHGTSYHQPEDRAPGFAMLIALSHDRQSLSGLSGCLGRLVPKPSFKVSPSGHICVLGREINAVFALRVPRFWEGLSWHGGGRRPIDRPPRKLCASVLRLCNLVVFHGAGRPLLYHLRFYRPGPTYPPGLW